MNLERRETSADLTYLSLSGRLDLEGTEAIEHKFALSATSSSRPVIVDVSEVSFLASLGMRMFVTAAKSLRSKGLSMVLLAPNEVVRDALEVTGLSQLLLIADDEATAFSLVQKA
jgi:anti-sigma B factor antagonist